MKGTHGAGRVLALNTLAFTFCFAVWTLYGVLITFLVDNRVVDFDKAQIGWLLGIPVLTGSLLRLPVGMLTDRYGGKPVFLGVLILSAISVFLTGYANTFSQFVVGGLAFGLSGAGFAVGIGYSSIFFPKERQGTALGIFGIGNAGSAVTSIGAPHLLAYFTQHGSHLEGWRLLPQSYGIGMLVMALVFGLLAVPKKIESSQQKSVAQMLAPLKDMRVWRFGLYYFVVFGAYVALSQWLIPYYLNVYAFPLATAGMMAAVYSLPSGVIRALGGYVSDRVGARTTMYWVLSLCAIFFLLLVAPRMEITSPGQGVMADRAGTVTAVGPTHIAVDGKAYPLKAKPLQSEKVEDTKTLVWPTFQSWQEPSVEVGQKIKKKEVLARGVTHLYFQANVWIFTALVFAAGIMMGIGKAAVYKHIPEYFPNSVGVVGGIVGVIGGLGGFVCPILFGMMLRATGLWTTCWLFLGILTIFSLVWMHLVILRMTRGMTAPGPLDQEAAA